MAFIWKITGAGFELSGAPLLQMQPGRPDLPTFLISNRGERTWSASTTVWLGSRRGARPGAAVASPRLVAQGANGCRDVLDNHGHRWLSSLGRRRLRSGRCDIGKPIWPGAVEAAEKLGGFHGWSTCRITQPSARWSDRRRLGSGNIPITITAAPLGMKGGKWPAMERVVGGSIVISVSCRPQGLARVLRYAHQMAPAGRPSRQRSTLAAAKSLNRSSRSNRYDMIAFSARPIIARADEAVPMHPLRNAGGGLPPAGGVPALR